MTREASRSAASSTEHEPDDAGLLVEAVGCSAGYRLLFDSLSFHVPPGRWLRLTGPNGSGKSTLLRAIAGLGRPTAGQIFWNGEPRVAGSVDWHSLMLYQGHLPGWKDAFSARDNLLLQRALDGGLPADDSASHTDALLERCGLHARANLAFQRLSAGQRHRVSLARLADSNRALWLLDEPTTALDSAGHTLFGRLLAEHLIKGGCAVIATHLPIAYDQAPIELDLGQRAGTATGGGQR